MKQNLTNFLMAILCSSSLIASTAQPHLSELIKPAEELALSLPTEQFAFEEYILPDEAHIIVDETYDESLEDPLDPPNDEDTTNIEEDYSTTNPPKMDVNKVLYDPKMNYGKGAPVPKPAPASTVKRSVIVVAASVMFATLAVSLVSANKGRDAP